MALRAVSHVDFLTETTEQAAFWVDQLIPQGGIVLLWGHTSIGKSPLSWHLALSIATGTPFFYLKTRPGKVLYIELDTPDHLVRERVKLLPPYAGPNLRWAFASSLLPETTEWAAINTLAATYRPDVVFINTLRKAHSGSDIESHVPSEVYSRFQKLFAGAAVVFIHHPRKTKADNDNVPASEGFSGSQAWQNDAQLVARLHRFKPSPEEDGGTYLALDVTKSQVCATGEVLRLYLLPDGTNLAPLDYTTAIMAHIQHPEWSQKELAEKLGLNQSTVSRAIKKFKALQ